jgi:hypothetical protein
MTKPQTYTSFLSHWKELQKKIDKAVKKMDHLTYSKTEREYIIELLNKASMLIMKEKYLYFNDYSIRLKSDRLHFPKVVYHINFI